LRWLGDRVLTTQWAADKSFQMRLRACRRFSAIKV
jgi:hypothetical protein